MASAPTAESTSGLFDGSPLLGFKCLVSPTKQVGYPTNTSLGSTPVSWNVTELHERVNEGAKVAPSLLHVVLETLQREQISPEAQEAILQK